MSKDTTAKRYTRLLLEIDWGDVFYITLITVGFLCAIFIIPILAWVLDGFWVLGACFWSILVALSLIIISARRIKKWAYDINGNIDGAKR